MASSSRSRAYDDRRVTVRSAVPVGQLWQLGDGQVGAYNQSQAAVIGQFVQFLSSGQYAVPIAPSISILDGGRVYWSPTNLYASYYRATAGDYYLGRAVGDALAASNNGQVIVNINANPAPDLELARDPYSSVLVGTAAAGGFAPEGGPVRRGGTLKFALAATNEAEKVDALGKDPIPAGLASSVIELAVNVIAQGGGSAATFFAGIASGTHATSVTSVTEYLGVKLVENDQKIRVEAADGTTTLAATDTLKTYTVGLGSANRFEVWLDCRNPAAVTVYVNGVQVLAGTTINVGAAASAWYLLAHLVKTASTDTFEVDLDWARARFATQRGV